MDGQEIRARALDAAIRAFPPRGDADVDVLVGVAMAFEVFIFGGTDTDTDTDDEEPACRVCWHEEHDQGRCSGLLYAPGSIHPAACACLASRTVRGLR